MKKKLFVLILLISFLSGLLLIARDISETVPKHLFLTPEQIDPYTYKLHMGPISPSSDYRKQADENYITQHYEDAARYYLAHLQYDPTDINALYNLSRCYGMLNQPDLAVQYIKLAYNNGFTNVKHLARDKSFKKVRSTQVFKTTIDSLKAIKK